MQEFEERALRQFQEPAAKFLIEGLRRMLIVDMGLGKTPIASKAAATRQSHRILVICPENALEVWGGSKEEYGDGRRWLEQFLGERVTVHFMNEEPWNRELEWNKPTPSGEYHLYIVVFNTFARDMGIGPKPKAKDKFKARQSIPRILKTKQGFDCVIVDEARRIRNRSSAIFRSLQELFKVYNIPMFIPMTGTPGLGPEHFWAMLHLIDSKRFRSYWQFVESYCEIEISPYGQKQIVGLRADRIQSWHTLIRQYAYVIKEDDPGIADQRPPITRQKLFVNMDEEQEKLYKAIQKDMMAISGDDIIVAQNSFVQLLRMRQILICPQILLPNSTVGGALSEVRYKILEGDFKMPTVIFTPFTDAFGPFTRFLGQKINKAKLFTLKSGDSLARIHDWRRNEGIIICSIQYAQAFSLEPATKCFFIGYDWDPDMNRQAEKRLHRLTTLNPINAYYCVHRKTIEPFLVDRLNIKQEKINVTTPRQLRELFDEGGHLTG